MRPSVFKELADVGLQLGGQCPVVERELRQLELALVVEVEIPIFQISGNNPSAVTMQPVHAGSVIVDEIMQTLGR